MSENFNDVGQGGVSYLIASVHGAAMHIDQGFCRGCDGFYAAAMQEAKSGQKYDFNPTQYPVHSGQAHADVMQLRTQVINACKNHSTARRDALKAVLDQAIQQAGGR